MIRFCFSLTSSYLRNGFSLISLSSPLFSTTKSITTIAWILIHHFISKDQQRSGEDPVKIRRKSGKYQVKSDANPAKIWWASMLICVDVIMTPTNTVGDSSIVICSCFSPFTSINRIYMHYRDMCKITYISSSRISYMLL